MGLKPLGASSVKIRLARVLVLTTLPDEPRVRDAIQAGATGYCLRGMLQADLLRALRDVAIGRPVPAQIFSKHLMREVAVKPPLRKSRHRLMTA